jgi:hypothetical protein
MFRLILLVISFSLVSANLWAVPVNCKSRTKAVVDKRHAEPPKMRGRGVQQNQIDRVKAILRSRDSATEAEIFVVLRGSGPRRGSHEMFSMNGPVWKILRQLNDGDFNIDLIWAGFKKYGQEVVGIQSVWRSADDLLSEGRNPPILARGPISGRPAHIK